MPEPTACVLWQAMEVAGWLAALSDEQPEMQHLSWQLFTLHSLNLCILSRPLKYTTQCAPGLESVGFCTKLCSWEQDIRCARSSCASEIWANPAAPVGDRQLQALLQHAQLVLCGTMHNAASPDQVPCCWQRSRPYFADYSMQCCQTTYACHRVASSVLSFTVLSASILHPITRERLALVPKDFPAKCTNDIEQSYRRFGPSYIARDVGAQDAVVSYCLNLCRQADGLAVRVQGQSVTCECSRALQGGRPQKAGRLALLTHQQLSKLRALAWQTKLSMGTRKENRA